MLDRFLHPFCVLRLFVFGFHGMTALNFCQNHGSCYPFHFIMFASSGCQNALCLRRDFGVAVVCHALFIYSQILSRVLHEPNRKIVFEICVQILKVAIGHSLNAAKSFAQHCSAKYRIMHKINSIDSSPSEHCICFSSKYYLHHASIMFEWCLNDVWIYMKISDWYVYDVRMTFAPFLDYVLLSLYCLSRAWNMSAKWCLDHVWIMFGSCLDHVCICLHRAWSDV